MKIEIFLMKDEHKVTFAQVDRETQLRISQRLKDLLSSVAVFDVFTIEECDKCEIYCKIKVDKNYLTDWH